MSEIQSPDGQNKDQDLVNVSVDKHTSPEIQEYVTSVVEKARKIIETFLPEALPQQPTQFIPVNKKSSIEGTGGIYYGKLRGKHYVTLAVGNTYDDEERESAVKSLVHQLLHQRHAEEVGQKAFLGIDPDAVISDDEIGRCVNNRQVADLIDRKTPPYADNLYTTFLEGVALFGERHLMYMVSKKAAKEGDMGKARAYLGEQRRITRLVCDIKRRERKGHGFGADPDFDGSSYIGRNKIMGKLSSIAGLSDLLPLFKKVDLGECRKIKRGDERYMKIINDPRLLPGLENYPLFTH